MKKIGASQKFRNFELSAFLKFRKSLVLVTKIHWHHFLKFFPVLLRVRRTKSIFVEYGNGLSETLNNIFIKFQENHNSMNNHIFFTENVTLNKCKKKIEVSARSGLANPIYKWQLESDGA
jgi:hypothetical protein